MLVDYLCRRCGQYFNTWTGTPLQQTHYRPSEIMRLIAGIHEGISTAQLARELGRDRSALSKWRRRLERWVTETFGRPPHGKKAIQRGLRDEGSRPMSGTTVSLQFGKKSPKRRKRS
jgi:transposase-like protein